MIRDIDPHHILDALSLTVLFGTLVQFLPAIAATLSIVWTVIRIFETDTVRSWLGKPTKNRDE